MSIKAASALAWTRGYAGLAGVVSQRKNERKKPRGRKRNLSKSICPTVFTRNYLIRIT